MFSMTPGLRALCVRLFTRFTPYKVPSHLCSSKFSQHLLNFPHCVSLSGPKFSSPSPNVEMLALHHWNGTCHCGADEKKKTNSKVTTVFAFTKP